MRLGPGKYLGTTVRSRQIAGLRLTLSAYPAGRVGAWHAHANPTLFLLLEGQHRDRWPQADHDQSALSFVYHPADQLHATEVGPAGMRGLNVELERGWLDEHAIAEGSLGGWRVLGSAGWRLHALRLLALVPPGETSPAAEDASLVLEVVEPLVQVSGLPGRGAAPGWLVRAEGLLHEGFRTPLTLRGVAREVGVHPVHLARVFRTRHGCSVSEYLRTLRLIEAGSLILRGRSLAEAACEAGFCDQAHLCRWFARLLGTSPGSLKSLRERAAPRMLRASKTAVAPAAILSR